MRFLYFLLVFLPLTTFSYPQFIGHNYVSCFSCHYNPFGGGVVNDYGRSVAATAIASRALYPDSVKEDDLADYSNFFFKKTAGEHLRPHLSYRGFNLISNPWEGDRQKSRWIDMQLDARLLFKAGDRDQYLASASISRLPQSDSLPLTDDERWRTREHFIGYRPIPEIGIYAGLMDKVYGLRVIEHTSYARTTTQNTMNDQTHGVVVHGIYNLWEGGVHAFLGNLDQREDLRMKGGSFILERTVWQKHRLGFTGMESQNNYLRLDAAGILSRWNLGSGSALSTEVGQVERTVKATNELTISRYGLAQVHYEAFRGMYFFSQFEYSKPDKDIATEEIKIGPGIQYYPIQRIELRADFVNTRPIPKTESGQDSWMFILQVHLWM